MRQGYACIYLVVSLCTCANGPNEPGLVSAQSQTGPVGSAERSEPSGFSADETRLSDRAPERAARALLQQKSFSAAEDMLSAAVAVDTSAMGRGRKRWMLGQAQRGAGHLEGAERTLGELASSDHPLAARARLRLASLLVESNPKRALSLLSTLTSGHAFSRRARLLTATALKASGKRTQAMTKLTELLDAVPPRASGAFAAMPLAELHLAQGTRAGKVKALALLQRIRSRAPLSKSGKLAHAKHREILASLPKRLRSKYARATVEDEFTRGEALFRSHAHKQAIQLFESIAIRVKGDEALVCKADLQRGRALLKKRSRVAGAKLMQSLLQRCNDPDLRAWARYYAGKALLRTGQPKQAMVHYDALAKEAPEHRLADDGLFQAAIAAADNDDRPGMRQRLEQLVVEHPKGDMRREALFTLAWDARKEGHHEVALKHFETLVAMGNKGLREGMHGRSSYWQARTLATLGRRSKSIEVYAELARAFPLSYHAQQALTRLHELDPTLCTALRRELSAASQAPLRFARTAAMAKPGFAAAIALLQVGDFDSAAQEFEYLGLSKRGAAPNDLWLVAALYDAAGAYPKASAIARGRLRGFMTEAPTGTALHKWHIAYPKAFAPLVEQAAAEAHVPPAYVRAVAREESAFDPRAVSSAHAYGLIQLMRPTAKDHAKRLGLPSHPEALKRPEVNLRIGSQFIHFLWDRYRANPAVVPAAYNAGHGSVNRWLKARGGMDLDEWVERIPFGETRRYTRRVLQSYGTYSFLYEGHLPPLKKRLPRLK